MSIPKTIPYLICLLLLFTQCQKRPKKSPLVAPDDWREEVIQFPLDFAPSLGYKGTQHVRFAPDWGQKDSHQYFSYGFLWDIEKNPLLTPKKLESDMETYFDGIMKKVADKNKNSKTKIIKSKAFFESIDENNYIGKVLTYDAFIRKKEVELNILAEYLSCPSSNKHFVLFKISPQKIDHPIWDSLNKLNVFKECK